MIILKSENFPTSNLLAEFVNYNGIKRENIQAITVYDIDVTMKDFTIFYYGEQGVKEKTKSVFGWS
ncbi:MAG: hypothetical protein M3O71_26150 [Bacteroidota bacterium]|nr:hypothetical protein [Bacteroidota bacterium]